MGAFQIGFCGILLLLEFWTMADKNTALENISGVSVMTPKKLLANVKEVTAYHKSQIDRYWNILISAAIHLLLNIGFIFIDTSKVWESVQTANAILPLILLLMLYKVKLDLLISAKEASS